MRILGISGSLRRDSHNTRLLRAAAKALPPGARLDVYDGLRSIPPYDEDHEAREPAPPEVVRMRAAVQAADAILISTPEYNGSIPGQLKNALDWLSRPVATNVLRGKPVAVIGASTSLFGAVWAQAELRKVLRTIGAVPLEHELPIALAHEAFDERGELLAGEHRAELVRILEALIEAARERASVAA